MSILIKLGRLLGLHFAPDNHVIPILRLGQYHQARGPGFFWSLPIVDRALPAVKTSLYVGNYYFEEVLSQDNIPFAIQMTVLFTFEPSKAIKNAAAVLVRGDEHLLKIIVKDYASQGLRRLVARFDAETLGNPSTMRDIERDLTRHLHAQLKVLGMAPLPQGGLLIKETVPPELFKQTMLDIKHDEALLSLLQNNNNGELAQLLQQLLIANGLKNHDGEALMVLNTGTTNLSDSLNVLPLAKKTKALGNGKPHS